MKNQKTNTPSNTMIRFSNPEKFIGMTVTKRNLTATCIGYDKYKNKKNEETFLLCWAVSPSDEGEAVFIKTSWNFRVGDIPKNFEGCVNKSIKSQGD